MKFQNQLYFLDYSSDSSEGVHLVDAIADDNDNYLEENGEDVLLCNSVKMIREKLHIDGRYISLLEFMLTAIKIN